MKVLKRCLLAVLFCISGQIIPEEFKFFIVIPSYNNQEWYKKNLDSLLHQTYAHWRAVYINDASEDGTAYCVTNYLAEHDHQKRIQFIDNNERCGALANMYTAVQLAHDDEIVVCLDGDDWLAHDHVFERLIQEYQKPDVWLVYGSYLMYPWGHRGPFSSRFSKETIKNNRYRKDVWRTSHIRTFYAWLFKCIDVQDLMKDGHFFSVAADVAYMIPLLEMAGERISFIEDITYIYNLETPLNDQKLRRKEQLEAEHYIRAKKPYTRLQSVPERFIKEDAI